MSKARRLDYSPDEYISGVAGKLRADEQGVYWMVCSLIMSEGGAIDYDVRRLVVLCMMRPTDIRRIVTKLLDMGKLTLSEGKLYQKRALSEVERASNRIQTASENGSKGGRPAQKDKENQQDDKAGGSGGKKLTTNDQPPTTNGKDSAAEPPPDHFEEFWRAYPKREGDNPKKPARLSFERACRKGADPQRIIAGARALAQKHPVPTPFVPQAVTWLNQERWNDAESTGPPEMRRVRSVEEIIAERQAQNAATGTG